MTRQQKITFGEMRASGASRIIVHRGDYKCGHSVTMYPALWPDNVRLSDLEECFVCTVTAVPISIRSLRGQGWARELPRALLNFIEAVVAVNDVKRPSQFGQERDCWS